MLKRVLALVALGTGLGQPAAADCRFTMNFGFGSAELSIADKLLLRDLAGLYPDGPMALSAHADDDGSDAQNIAVAEARAAAVVAQMERSGLRSGAMERVFTVEAAWDVTPTRASSALNRRVELFIEDCDPERHPEARPLNEPGVALRDNGRIMLTLPRLPRR